MKKITIVLLMVLSILPKNMQSQSEGEAIDDAGEKICKADQLTFKLTFFPSEDKMMLEEGGKINELKNYNKSIKWIDSTNKFLDPHFKY